MSMKKTDLKKHLGYLIKVARTEEKMTQKRLAGMLKTKQSNIARAENEGCSLTLASKCLEVMGYELDPNCMRATDPFKRQGLTFYG